MLSATNGAFASASADALGAAVIASVTWSTVTPRGSAFIDDNASERRPLTMTICVRMAPSKRNGSRALRAGSAAPTTPNGAWAIGAMLVNLYSSSRVVGNPLATNAANACSRSARTRADPKAGFVWNAAKASA